MNAKEDQRSKTSQIIGPTLDNQGNRNLASGHAQVVPAGSRPKRSPGAPPVRPDPDKTPRTTAGQYPPRTARPPRPARHR